MTPNRSDKHRFNDFIMAASILLVAVGLIGIGAVNARLLLIALPAAAILLLLIPGREPGKRAPLLSAPPAGPAHQPLQPRKKLRLVEPKQAASPMRQSHQQAGHPFYSRSLQAVAAADKDIRHLRRIAGRLEDPPVSDAIRALCGLAEAINANVTGDPGVLPSVQRFYDYYLRTAKMLWSQYEVLVRSPFYNKDMEYQVKRIENLLEPLHRNFERYHARSMRGELNRVELEIGTMERVMRSEG